MMNTKRKNPLHACAALLLSLSAPALAEPGRLPGAAAGPRVLALGAALILHWELLRRRELIDKIATHL